MKISRLFVVMCVCICCSRFAPAQSDQPILEANKLFEPDRIVKIEFELAPEDWDTIRVQSRDFASSLTREPVDSPFTYVKANMTIDGIKINDVAIRKKGFLGSLHAERPSLKVNFAKYVKQKPIEGLSRLTLNNNNQDPGRILQYITYKLYNESGTHAPRCGFAAVTVNGKYLGIYSNVESVKPSFLERGFSDGSGPLFEGTVTDFYPDWVGKFELKNKAANRELLQPVVDAFAAEEIDLKQVERLIDVDAFIKFWAMESLTGFWDGYCSNQNNYFVYKNPENEKLYFIPWGTDSSLAKTTPLPPYTIRPRAVHARP